MSQYMLLLYAPEADEVEDARRWAELPVWNEVAESLSEAGMLVSNGPLSPVASATTVRVRGDEVELTDGPFAITKEVLVGYFLLECSDLDAALIAAAQLPAARYGSIEVRPLRELSAAAEAAPGGS